MISSIVNERYFVPKRPIHTYASLPYQLVPGPVRLLLFRLLASGQRDGGAGFPEWPVDNSVEALRSMFLRAWSLAGGAMPQRPRWPQGRQYAFSVSHDVDTAHGYRLIPEVAAYEASLGLRSCWFVVGHLYQADPAVLDALRRQGHEIGLHGDRHDNRIAYLSRRQIQSRLASCCGMLKRFEVRGWRSPSLLESPLLRELLGTSFLYTSDVPDTEVDSLVAPRRGCATCFPFVKQGLLEIPLTLPLEDKLLISGLGEQQILELWRKKVSWARSVGGVAQLTVHNEPHLLRRCRGAYEQLLREACDDDSAWRATLGEIADWWLKEHA
jgi:peptidoglycan/xylan/chitin deacetylase (PgdA/CDA1 family)